MPTYQSTPFKPPVRLLMPGAPEYVFGSLNDRVGPTMGYVISDSAVTTTGTLKFQILSGNIPVVGMLISVVGTANGSGHFNVSRVAVASVSGDPITGIYTVTYTIVSSTVAANTPDTGSVIIEQVQTGEALSFTTSVASIPVTVSFNNPATEMGRSISASVQWTSAPSAAVSVTLQGANFDLDAEYADVLTVMPSGQQTAVFNACTGQGTAATAAAVNLPNYRFWRLKVSGSGSITGTLIGKIED